MVRTESFIFPRVSIIVVNYNGSKWLRKFMHTLANTSYPDFEIIVVDNGSSDNSIEFLEKQFNQIKIVRLSQNIGFGRAINSGVHQATGTVLAFVNNDMEFPENWLTQSILELYSQERVGAVQCKVLQYFDKQTIDFIGLSVDRYNLAHPIGHDETDQGSYDNLKEVGACAGGAMVVPTNIFLQIGCFDPVYFMYYEDIDLSWRIKFAGYKIKPCRSSIVYHVGSASSGTSHGTWNPSPFLAFETTKNYVYCWLKNSPTRIIITCWPIVSFIILSQSLFPLLRRKPRTFLGCCQGIIWILRHLRLIRKKRSEIKNDRKRSSENSLFVKTISQDSSNLRRRFRRISNLVTSLIMSRS